MPPTILNTTGMTENLPNYIGTIYNVTPTQTPFTSLVGGMAGANAVTTQNWDFPIGSFYGLRPPKQPAISEQESLTAPLPTLTVRNQEENTTQIFHESVDISYGRLSNAARLSGLNTANTSGVQNEMDFQIKAILETVALDIEKTFLNGVYVRSIADNVARKTRGMMNAAQITLAAAGAKFDMEMISDMMEAIWEANGGSARMFIFTNSTQKRKITKAYAAATGEQRPPTRVESGVNITEILTDFGTLSVVLANQMPANAILGADLTVIRPVEHPVPGKGNFFFEELAKKGASDSSQMYGQLGLDHGPGYKHFTITGLEV